MAEMEAQLQSLGTFLSVTEAGQEDSKAAIIDVVHKMELNTIIGANISVYHRIGVQ